jgi:hypothetical protein
MFALIRTQARKLRKQRMDPGFSSVKHQVIQNVRIFSRERVAIFLTLIKECRKSRNTAPLNIFYGYFKRHT